MSSVVRARAAESGGQRGHEGRGEKQSNTQHLFTSEGDESLQRWSVESGVKIAPHGGHKGGKPNALRRDSPPDVHGLPQ